MTVTARRTILRPGKEEAYVRTHAMIPSAVATALRECGVLRWEIWRDGRFLFHHVHTVETFDEMVRLMAARGPIDPEWDRLIASMVSDVPGDSDTLQLVWGMDDRAQWDR